MDRASRLLCIAAAGTALITGCGSEKSAIRTIVTHPTSSGNGGTEPAKDTGTDSEDPENPKYLEKKLDDGDCAGVASDTDETLATSGNSTDRAEAHLFHALAIACGGHDAAAELDQAEASRTLLSDESVKILDRVKAQGVPRSPAQVHAVLPLRITTTTTTTTATTATTATTTT